MRVRTFGLAATMTIALLAAPVGTSAARSTSRATSKAVGRATLSGPWASLPNCPVDSPAMLDVPAGTYSACLGVQQGFINAAVGKDALFVPTRPGVQSAPAAELQLGVAGSSSGEQAVPATQGQTLVIQRARLRPPGDPTDGCINLILSPPLESLCYGLTQRSSLTSIYADVLLAGRPTGVDTNALSTLTSPALTLPLKFHLIHPGLGTNCYVGSDQHPVLATLSGGFGNDQQTVQDPNGYPVTITTGTFGLSIPYGSSMAEPGATGCGPFGLADAAVDQYLGLPARDGFTLLGYQGALAETTAGGQVLSQAWNAAAQ
jgi:hypothetical protein